MNKFKRTVTLGLATIMVLGMTLTANAATPRNSWCHAGAADIVVSGTHDHGDGSGVHEWTGLKCHACNNIKVTSCHY